MTDKRRSDKSSPALAACRLATQTWRADSRCVTKSLWVGRFGGGGSGGGTDLLGNKRKLQRGGVKQPVSIRVCVVIKKVMTQEKKISIFWI